MALKIEELQAPPGTSRNEIIAKYKQQKARKKKSKSAKKYREREEAQRLELLSKKYGISVEEVEAMENDLKSNSDEDTFTDSEMLDNHQSDSVLSPEVESTSTSSKLTTDSLNTSVETSKEQK